jgi:hypothetical protein
VLDVSNAEVAPVKWDAQIAIVFHLAAGDIHFTALRYSDTSANRRRAAELGGMTEC